MYSRGAAAIAEQIGSTKEEAQEIIDNFYNSFPTVKAWMDDSLKSLKEKGYVEDFYGRRRRLTDINIVPYKVSFLDKSVNTEFNPFINCQDKVYNDPTLVAWTSIVGSSIINSNLAQLRKGNTPNDEMSNKKYESLAKLAMANTLNDKEILKLITDNNKLFSQLQSQTLTSYNFETKHSEQIIITSEIKNYINKIQEQYPIIYLDKDCFKKTRVNIEAFTGRRAQAERQCVNARIQGSSATMTKVAMNKITTDEELASYGFKLLIGVHDELIGEVKEEFAQQGAARLCEIMKTCVSDLISVPFKCDPSIVSRWYEDEMAYSLQDKYKDMLATGKTPDEAFAIIAETNSEFDQTQITELLNFKD